MADDETSLAVDQGRRNLLNWFLGTTAGAFFNFGDLSIEPLSDSA